MNVGIVAVGILVGLMGIIQIVFPDFVWRVDKAFHEMNGVTPQRSDAWDLGRVVRGIVFILVGVLFIWIAAKL